MDIFWGFYRMPAEMCDWAMINERIECCAHHYTLLDHHLANRPYLAGDEFTMADIPTGTTLYHYFGLEIEHPSVSHVEAWYARLQSRPAYAQHIMYPFEELRGRLDY